jgi:putative intracellular protease/amidase
MRVLFPLPCEDFDPTEAAIPWKALTEAGHEVVFATPGARVAHADPRVLSGRGFGPWKPFLRAIEHARKTYEEMAASPAFLEPIALETVDPSDFDAVHLTGGHAPGMRPYLESEPLQRLVGTYLAESKPVGAICHGVLVVARAKDPSSGEPALRGRKTTALLRSQELTGWALTGLWLGPYYRTYPETVEDEVIASLSSPADFVRGPFSIRREGPDRPAAGFALRDGNYLSARFYGDAYRYARELVDLLNPEPARAL